MWKGLVVLVCVVFMAVMASGYQVGMGISDVTGPAAEIIMMGYAHSGQSTKGIHTRQRSRALIVNDGKNRIVYVSADICMVFQSVKITVVEKLRSIYGDLYTEDNVLLHGTHTHSGPGGFSWYMLYDISILGFIKDNFDVIVEGIVRSIVQAHNSLQDGKIMFNKDYLIDPISNINRSPSAYVNNPEEEKKKYLFDTDKDLSILKVVDAKGKPIGATSWFGVHCTSMTNKNHLISGDNKGYASYLFEKYVNGNSSLPGKGPFIALFGQSNSGDVSPNIKGGYCPDGKPCDERSTCGGDAKKCQALGPGKDEFESTAMIGRNQFEKTLELFQKANLTLEGSVEHRHVYVDLHNVIIRPEFITSGVSNATTCDAAMGYSFAAGTIDGSGDFDFKQGDNSTGNPLWNFLKNFIAKPSEETIKCQRPKPILIAVGDVKPYAWTPNILPLQMLKVGQLIIIGTPAEFTTMAGRRLRETVRRAFNKHYPDQKYEIVIAALANTYTGYVTTFEEYQVQRYEGASCIFGPHALEAYQQNYYMLAEAIATGQPVPPGPTPPNKSNQTLNFHPGVVVDTVPIGKKYGDVYQNVEKKYRLGQKVTVKFWGAHLRNNLKTESTFLTVERMVSPNQWEVVLVDGDWDTKLFWERHGISESIVTVTWDISPYTTQLGTYRIRHFGAHKTLLGKIIDYEGASSNFDVVA